MKINENMISPHPTNPKERVENLIKIMQKGYYSSDQGEQAEPEKPSEMLDG